MSLSKKLLVSIWATIVLGLGHIGKTYLDLADVRGKLAVCEQRVSDMEKKIADEFGLPGADGHDGAGAPR